MSHPHPEGIVASLREVIVTSRSSLSLHYNSYVTIKSLSLHYNPEVTIKSSSLYRRLRDRDHYQFTITPRSLIHLLSLSCHHHIRPLSPHHNFRDHFSIILRPLSLHHYLRGHFTITSPLLKAIIASPSPRVTIISPSSRDHSHFDIIPKFHHHFTITANSLRRHDHFTFAPGRHPFTITPRSL